MLQFIGGLAYLLAHKLNELQVFNHETFKQELRKIERNKLAIDIDKPDTTAERTPLITLSNHISCIDDPVLWSSLLPLTYYSTNTDSVRWSAAAIDICFSKPWHSAFFSLGKTFPIIRGAGIHQPAMEFASALLEDNQWLHLFPEGRVMRDDQQQVISNKDRGYLFKWGISKLILDYFRGNKVLRGSRNAKDTSDKHLRILPFYHLGMDKVLPIGRPYIPRFGNRITIYIRPTVINMSNSMLNSILTEPTNFNTSANEFRGDSLKSKTDDEIKRVKVTRFLEVEMEKLIEPATEKHLRANK